MNEDKKLLTQYQALVMQLHAAGAEIEMRLGCVSGWQPCMISPNWIWDSYHYRPVSALTDEQVYSLPWDEHPDAICAAMNTVKECIMFLRIPLLDQYCFSDYAYRFYMIFNQTTDIPWLQSFVLRPGLGDRYPSLAPYCLPAREETKQDDNNRKGDDYTGLSKPVLDLLIQERTRQDAKWGEQNHKDLYWLGILMEEVGELAKAIIEGDHKHAAAELVQTTAVGVAWLECIERRTEVAT